jgi:hypothetical protein
MATCQECVDYARKCIQLAELTRDSELRDHLVGPARDWMATKHEDKAPRPKSLTGSTSERE